METPEFSKFEVLPCFVKKLNYASASYKSPQGIIRSEWKREGDKILCRFDIPQGSCADVILSEKKTLNVSGSVEFIVPVV